MFRLTSQRSTATFLRQSPSSSLRISTPIRNYSDSKPQPKILNEKPPKEEDQPKEVQEHNQDLKNRAIRPNDTEEGKKSDDGTDEKVDKGFWKG
jgi:hypothetical protein